MCPTADSAGSFYTRSAKQEKHAQLRWIWPFILPPQSLKGGGKGNIRPSFFVVFLPYFANLIRFSNRSKKVKE